MSPSVLVNKGQSSVQARSGDLVHSKRLHTNFAVQVKLLHISNVVNLVQDLQSFFGHNSSSDILTGVFELLGCDFMAVSELTQDMNKKSNSLCTN